jgi:hypothetical protein
MTMDSDAEKVLRVGDDCFILIGAAKVSVTILQAAVAALHVSAATYTGR